VQGRKNTRDLVNQFGATSPTSGGIHGKKENLLSIVLVQSPT